ncbi:hypothetical protein [uncultured Nocardioides sp.]|uniref:DUF7674 family protein n=1 Tax=uncultured Nocardioides sp. TaxID=198441 RepID=UPI0026085294|nr:hypothetical protein [uncultured Nocardioides sp.]
MNEEADFTNRLVTAAPELGSLLDEHLSDQEGELLAYVLMSDVARWLTAQCSSSPRRVQEILSWLETEYIDGNFDVRNLIDVGIVEMLPTMPDGASILDMLGPALRARAEVAGLLLDEADGSTT